MERWEVKELVDKKIEESNEKLRKEFEKDMVTMFVVQLAPVKPWIAAIKFIATAVALLVIGTLYQFFVSLANAGVGR